LYAESRDVKFEEESAFRKSLQDTNIMKEETPQQEEIPIPQNSRPLLENKQEGGQPMSPRKKKPKWPNNC
jgi:hypothetical protein